MSKNVKLHEKLVKINVLSGKTKGDGASSLVDIIMYLSILFFAIFAFFAYKKLQDQKSTLIMWNAYPNICYAILTKLSFHFFECLP